MGKYQKTRSFWRSLGQASRGILYSSKTQKHLQFHIFAGSLVLATAWWCHLTRIEVVLLVLTIGSVITAEVMNTAIELVVDLAEPNFHPIAGMAKDVAAGAVLVTALQSVVIGVILFGPRLWEWIRYSLE
ncbi:diacylglycerol kinase family protein [Desulfitobacterium metallireducens]|uniref:Diacylglycerol kinase n=1 Tax=Desulfitobacterium metallireducens DSM 15288 TaxID=871968 RepID=W0EEA8_9FIRM|nr:diacylglycerol kinase family protein [Desulfitobacterium metallireducens]AHF07848.1 diacylglycerol kinase [Desulfitobacterium metallireducens DSM 15288]